jgi:hypothetical protein
MAENSSTPPKRALILTNRLTSFTGSEIVAVEVAETLYKLGYQVTMHCNLTSERFKKSIKAPALVSDGESFPNIFDYDFVWAQHSMLALCLDAHTIPVTSKTIIISAHLSPYEPFELAGIRIAESIGATFLANSEETAKTLLNAGIEKEKIVNFHNAGPAGFGETTASPTDSVKRILLVSNHIPEEVWQAAEFLKRKGVKISVIGKAGKTKRVEPRDLEPVNGVITIGKTCQYAMKCGVPVYCYDRFGGPGWINKSNFDNAEKMNFSGRCTPLKKNGKTIAKEILENYSEALSFSKEIRTIAQKKYSLEYILHILIQDSSPKQCFYDNARISRHLVTEAAQARNLRKLFRASESKTAEKILSFALRKLTPVFATLKFRSP